MDFLLGVPGKLKTLLDRLSATWAAKVDTLATDWSTARAAKQDNLDAAVTTRAAAATALSTAQWTNALATFLGLGPIKSIQYNYVQLDFVAQTTKTATKTISAVTVAKTIVIPASQIMNVGGNYTTEQHISLASTTSVSATIALTASSSGTALVWFWVIEFN